VHTIPEGLRHVLGSPTLHSHENLTGRLTYVAWKGRDALADGAAYCRKLVSEAPRILGALNRSE
jgi:hypothetical protein